MRIAYLDCFAGIAGDMFLGALLQAGVPADVMHEAVAALDIGASLKMEAVDRSGISAMKAHVLDGGELAELPQQAELSHSHQLQTQHLHLGGHANEDTFRYESSARHPSAEEDPSHAQGRSLSVIRELIQATPLHENVKHTAIRAFELLGYSEAKIHNVPVEAIHFHEVGAIDAIVDIVAASAGIHHLEIGKWYSSAVNVGGGMVQCAHGLFPVPAPATADLLRGVPTYSAHLQKELVTPTGAALLRALDAEFGPQPAMQVEAIGYGAGTRNPEGFPNVLRLSVGQKSESDEKSDADLVTVLETALDDLSPQLIAYAAEKMLAAGALDVMLTPVMMKKGRPGTLLTVLCNPADSAELQGLLLRETSTLGIRIRQDRRACLDRSHTEVATEFGSIRIKVGSADGEERNAAPEFEDCRKAAERHNTPLKQVQQAAIAAYWNRGAPDDPQ